MPPPLPGPPVASFAVIVTEGANVVTPPFVYRPPPKDAEFPVTLVFVTFRAELEPSPPAAARGGVVDELAAIDRHGATEYVRTTAIGARVFG